MYQSNINMSKHNGKDSIKITTNFTKAHTYNEMNERNMEEYYNMFQPFLMAIQREQWCAEDTYGVKIENLTLWTAITKIHYKYTIIIFMYDVENICWLKFYTTQIKIKCIQTYEFGRSLFNLVEW